jgi:hypothetical protein
MSCPPLCRCNNDTGGPNPCLCILDGTSGTTCDGVKEMVQLGGNRAAAAKGLGGPCIMLASAPWLRAQVCHNQCTGHGECQMGFCKCYPGWYGHDCSLKRKGEPIEPGEAAALCPSALPASSCPQPCACHTVQGMSKGQNIGWER